MTAPTDLQVQPDLTPQQRAFVDAYLGGMTPAAAGRVAGYAPSTIDSGKLMQSPGIAAAIRQARAGAEVRVKITRDEVLQGLLDATRASATATEMVMAWREIAKMQGYYVPEEKTITINRPGAIRRSQLEALPETELLKMVGISPGVIDAEFTMIPEPQDENGPDDAG